MEGEQPKKTRRGGKRPGAGRKPKEIRDARDACNRAMDKVVIPQLEAIFESLVRQALGDHDTPPDSRAAIYLVDRYLGKPRQALDIKDATKTAEAGPGVQEEARRGLAEWMTQVATSDNPSSS